MGTRPTTADAIRRRLVSYPAAHGGRGIARLVFVRGDKAKVQLQSGKHLTVPAAEVHVIAQPPAKALGPTP